MNRSGISGLVPVRSFVGTRKPPQRHGRAWSRPSMSFVAAQECGCADKPGTWTIAAPFSPLDLPVQRFRIALGELLGDVELAGLEVIAAFPVGQPLHCDVPRMLVHFA